jgi:hypothetical protein
MTDHLPECRLGEPCDIDIAKHGFCSLQVEKQFFCIHCMGECICNRLRTCEERVIATTVQRIKALPWTSETWLAQAERAAIIAAIKGDQP